MPNKPWKAFEREVARLFGGRRFWANSGEAIDVESDTTVAQCKHVQAMSLSKLCELAEMAERQGFQKNKAGVVCVKIRRGKGMKSTTIIVQTDTVWRYQHGAEQDREGRE